MIDTRAEIQRQRQLVELFGQIASHDAARLRAILRNSAVGERLLNDIPGDTAPLSTVADSATAWLLRQAALTPDFFMDLAAAAPTARDAIHLVAIAFGVTLGPTSPGASDVELTTWLNESLSAVESECAERIRRNERVPFGKGAFTAAYLLRAPNSAFVPLPTLAEHMDSVRLPRGTMMYPWYTRGRSTRMLKRGSCIQSWTDFETVPAVTFTRVSPQFRFFTVGTLTEDFVSRYSGYFVLDPYEVLTNMVHTIEHARQMANLSGLRTGQIQLTFGYQGLSGRELRFCSPRGNMDSISRGRAVDNEARASLSFTLAKEELTDRKIMTLLRGPIDEILMSFDLASIGPRTTSLDSFESQVTNILREERG